MTLDRSISLNVVRIAAVCCAETRRSAIFLRILLIGTRRTAPSDLLTGAVFPEPVVAAAKSTSVARDALAGAVSVRESMNFTTSPLVMRPPGPLGGIDDES